MPYPWMLASLLLLAACATAAPASGGAQHGRASNEEIPLSDPPEYQFDAPSRDAGERIFSRTGMGDPYATGIPYVIFLALQRAYPDQLGADMPAFARRFGFMERAADPASSDRDVRAGLPVGMHLTEDPIAGMEMLVTNCTLCHAQRIRIGDAETLVIGVGNKRIRVHEYDLVMSMLGKRSDLTTDRLAGWAEELAKQTGSFWRPQYGKLIAGATVRALRERAATREAYLLRVANGPPGLVASIESFAVVMEKMLRQEVPTGEFVGWAKIPDIVSFPVRHTLSWDAAGIGSKDALVAEADFAAGVRHEWFWTHPLLGPSLSLYLASFERDLSFPGAIDAELARAGRAAFEANCSDCHGSYADNGKAVRYEERIVPIGIIGTDTARSDAVTEAYVEAANDPRVSCGAVRARRTFGYVPPVLTDLWLRAPYGHAGQWPSLAVLAEAPEKRPTRFVLDLSGALDLEHVGVPIRAEGTPPGEHERVYDAQLPGFGVGGHRFLAELSDADKRAVLEYLKTL